MTIWTAAGRPNADRRTVRYVAEPWYVLREIERVPEGIDASWRARRACADAPVHILFPYRGDIETLRAAQRICAGCPVKKPCLDFALASHAIGICGGMAEQQRERMLGRRMSH